VKRYQLPLATIACAALVVLATCSAVLLHHHVKLDSTLEERARQEAYDEVVGVIWSITDRAHSAEAELRSYRMVHAPEPSKCGSY
jgi:hypothetical protein